MNIHDIRQSIAMLANLTRPHQTIRDIHEAIRLLDPITMYDDTAFNADGLYLGIHAMRDCYPDSYAEIVAAWHEGSSEHGLISLIAERLKSEFDYPFGFDEEFIIWGIPIVGLGFDFDWLNDFSCVPDDLITILSYFDITEDHRTYDHNAIARFIFSLDIQDDPQLHAIASMMRVLWGETGNTLADQSDESLAESNYEPIPWTPANIQFVHKMQTEAEELITTCIQTAHTILSDSPLNHIFQTNARKAIHPHASQSITNFHWQPSRPRTRTAPAGRAVFLPAWHHPAKTQCQRQRHRRIPNPSERFTRRTGTTAQFYHWTAAARYAAYLASWP